MMPMKIKMKKKNWKKTIYYHPKKNVIKQFTVFDFFVDVPHTHTQLKDEYSISTHSVSVYREGQLPSHTLIQYIDGNV